MAYVKTGRCITNLVWEFMTQLKMSKKQVEMLAKQVIQGRKDTLAKMHPKPAEKKVKDVRK